MTQSKLDPRLSALTALPRGAVEEMVIGAAPPDPVQRGWAPRGASGLERGSGAGAPSQDAAPLAHGIRMRAGDGHAGPPELVAAVLVQFQGDAAALEELGARIKSRAGDLFTAEVAFDVIEHLAADRRVIFVELSRPAFPLLERSVPAIGADVVHRAATPNRGAGTVVGVIDVDGIDLHHRDFFGRDGDPSKTRITHLWDQRASASRAARRRIPEPWGYGVEYTASDIDADVASGAPYSVVEHRPDVAQGAVGHGTHMAGIAAGNGAASEGVYAGVAPEADIIFVNTGDSETRGLADMGQVCDAIAYVFDRAGDKPCVIDVSLGDNLGPHDGTSLVERFIDWMVEERPGRAVVVAAGNCNAHGKHAELDPSAGGPVLELQMPHNVRSGEAIEIWYAGDDRLDLVIEAPGGERSDVVRAGERSTVARIGGARIVIGSVIGDRRNGDNAIALLIEPAGPAVVEGAWRIELARSPGWPAPPHPRRVHAWIDRNTTLAWQHPTEGRCTLTTPATARGAITVGNFMHRRAVRAVSNASSRGPTRDGREKPDLVAPGQGIEAPRACLAPRASCEVWYGGGLGTSQAAAHVAGVVALVFRSHGSLGSEALKALLLGSADRDPPERGWNPAFGHGVVCAARACAAAKRGDETPARGAPRGVLERSMIENGTTGRQQ